MTPVRQGHGPKPLPARKGFDAALRQQRVADPPRDRLGDLANLVHVGAHAQPVGAGKGIGKVQREEIVGIGVTVGMGDEPACLQRLEADFRFGLVSGFGMINYDRGLSTGAAVLAA